MKPLRLIWLLPALALVACAGRAPVALRPNHVFIESNRPEATPIAARYIRRKGYVPVPGRDIAQAVLTINVESGSRPYASSRFSTVEYEHDVPVSLKMTDRQGGVTWHSQARGEAHTRTEALRLALRDGIEGYQRHHAGLFDEIFKTPLDVLLKQQRPRELPDYKE